MRFALSFALLLSACTDSLTDSDVLTITSELHKAGPEVPSESGPVVLTTGCHLGGTLVADGIVSASDSRFDFAGAMLATDCGIGVESGEVTLSIPRSIAEAATIHSHDDSFTISDRFTGTFDWALDSGSGTCDVDVVVEGEYTPFVVGHWESVVTYRGTICDTTLAVRCTPSLAFGNSCTEL